MLTKLIIKNFKRFDDVSIDLGNPVVFIGPNNSGKTTALQALALWALGLKRWNEKRAGKASPEKRPGVTINRRDLLALPVPDANLLWLGRHVRSLQKAAGKPQTSNIRIDITVEGVTEGRSWACGFEFDYANAESFYCRPLREGNAIDAPRMIVPQEAGVVDVAFLPPMSGLAGTETRLDPGAISVRLGEGRTAEVLRNLCFQLANYSPEDWKQVKSTVHRLFRIQLGDPDYIAERGEIAMDYEDAAGIRLDLSSSGRGLQQTLLLLAHLYVNPRSVLLLDEPDAHLEILRQREIYQILTRTAAETGSQIIAASHSEVVLGEAADRDVVVAFVGRPHRIDDRSGSSQVSKSLKEIGFDQYYQAEQKGWVIYLEGSTDLQILQSFAEALNHSAGSFLASPFVKYVGNQPSKAREHFYGLREAKGDLVGFALFDRLSTPLDTSRALVETMWQRYEIECYLCQRDTLLGWAQHEGERDGGPIFGADWKAAMEQSISEIETALEKLGRGTPWDPNTKASEEFLDPLFADFFRRLHLPNLMRKTDYHALAPFVPKAQIDEQVSRVLDGIVEVGGLARRSD